jgi:hypothetical protein
MPSCFYLKSTLVRNLLNSRKNATQYQCTSGPAGDNISEDDRRNFCEANFKRCPRYKRVR